MKIKVGVPYARHGRITYATLHSLKELEKCADFETRVVIQQGSYLPHTRNTLINGDSSDLIHQSLGDFDYYLCVDADTGFNEENVKQLLAHDLDIVSGAYIQKRAPAYLMAGNFGEIKGLTSHEDRLPHDATGLHEVDWVGAGFMLIKREALEAMEHPWFGCVRVAYDTPEGPCAHLTSDHIGFAINAHNAGLKIMIDADCRVAHLPHSNEQGGSLSDALNDLLRNRDTIVRHVKAISDENRLLKQLVEQEQVAD